MSPKRTTVTTDVFAGNECGETRFSKFHCTRVGPTAKWWSGRLSMANMLGMEKRICFCCCKRFSSGCALGLHSILPLWRHCV